MSNNALMSMKPGEAACTLCGKPIEDGRIAVTLYTDIYTATAPDEDVEIAVGDRVIDQDWGEEGLAHVACMSNAINNAIEAYREKVLVNWFDSIARRACVTNEQLAEYWAECEHQDGKEYWLRFADWTAVATDVKLYWENAK